MNARVLELIKNPDLFQPADLKLLENEIAKTPYVQSFRALHLYGTHLFERESYSAKLSETAAFTTDKKILYRFINKNVEPVVETESIAETKISEDSVSPIAEPVAQVPHEEIPKPKPVFVNGELNRILYEGEEDFMDRKPEIIDLESTMESGVLVTQKTEEPIIEIPEKAEDINENHSKEISEKVEETEFTETPDAEDFSKETLINEEKISENEKLVENTADVNFHGMDDFLPQVKIESKDSSVTKIPLPKPAPNRHEEEMQRLIAEVEAKMKAAKKEKVKPVEEPIQNTDINFAETESFVVDDSNKKNVETPVSEEKTESVPQPEITEIEEITEEKTNIPASEKIEPEKEEIQIQPQETSEKPVWKPMQLSSNLPDSLIDQKKEKPAEKKIASEEIPSAEVKKDVVETKQNIKEEIPALNVSFFGKEVSTFTQEEEKTTEPADNQPTSKESNVPVFINTWQNWLKIDRTKTEEQPTVSAEEKKNQLIDTFIENEPKISKLKEDSDFVVKDKGDNISHLMTETLANLYVEQKLYSKAIKAYETLSEKHPEKKELFADKIQEIKDLRQNKP
ncbi:hypothetical protein MTP09_01065 [Chryseobacterium suipulveris]|uniref:Tetratricopeptide repeat protein n=1 Tax=Chryseobacterium suipulveris TaxID=2929800 RepID=A0ABY4BQ75_9FLAO|nr:hypothetical protein [Chryseobacterium suipulveris]UOE41265.1 hypothetical protein MTP09_01065 [Chryseobacterium suipulveris]